MKINVFLIFCVLSLILSTILCYHSEPQLIMKTAQILAPRFSEVKAKLQETLSSNSEMKLKLRNSNPHNFHVTISLLRETDEAKDKPKEIHAMVNYSREGINVVKKKKTIKTITYTE
jgi:P pilus assembly chaperone PapD